MKSLKPLLVIFTVILVSVLSFLFIKKFNINAQVTKTFTTTVTVGNSAPVITVAPTESPASSLTTPTTPGAAITFSATATDANNENYFLIICSTNAVTPGTSGGAPTCGGTQYCVSSSTATGTGTSCSYTTQATDPYTNNWYAFACDVNTTSASCSTSSQGTGVAGSPFIVNHPPSFTAVSNNSPQIPGANITWTTTASDPDGNTMRMFICKSSGASSAGCTISGDQLCSTALVTSNPTCSYTLPVPSQDQSYPAYVYIFDIHNTPAAGTGTVQGTNSAYTVSNVAPTVTNVTINNNGTAIVLEAGTTKAVPVTATVSDNNGCANSEISNVTTSVYRSAVGYAACDTVGEQNGNNCYPEIACTAGTCSGTTVPYTCSVPLQYYADPTDSNNIATSFATQNWLATVKATDNNTASGNATTVTGAEVNSLAAFNITTAINYGDLGADQSNDPLDRTVVTTPTGNVPLDQDHSGSQMCTNYPTCTGGTPLAVNLQKYALAASTSYASGTTLSATPTTVNLNVPKVDNGTVTTKTTWWGISIPLGTIPGVYNGVNTITSKINTAL